MYSKALKRARVAMVECKHAGVHHDTQAYLASFKSLIQPVALFGAEVWQTHWLNPTRCMDPGLRFQRLQSMYIKNLHGLTRSTPTWSVLAYILWAGTHPILYVEKYHQLLQQHGSTGVRVVT